MEILKHLAKKVYGVCLLGLSLTWNSVLRRESMRYSYGKGTPFTKKTFYLEKSEYAKIVSEINTNYGLYEGKAKAMHLSYGVDRVPYIYYFENHGYDCYNIYNKVINTMDLH